MDLPKAYGLIVAIAAVTFLFRSLPFAFFKYLEKSRAIRFIQLYLPASIMLLLVLYTLKDVSFESPNYGLIELTSVLLVVIAHLLWRNALISIAIGTGFFVLCQ